MTSQSMVQLEGMLNPDHPPFVRRRSTGAAPRGSLHGGVCKLRTGVADPVFVYGRALNIDGVVCISKVPTMTPYMFSTPLRALVSKDLNNLFFAGR